MVGPGAFRSYRRSLEIRVHGVHQKMYFRLGASLVLLMWGSCEVPPVQPGSLREGRWQIRGGCGLLPSALSRLEEDVGGGGGHGNQVRMVVGGV